MLTLTNQFVVGNAAEGTFEQLGGTVDQTSANGLLMGLNTGGVGTYNMHAGELNIDHISLAFNGDAYFNHSGGTVSVTGDINIGADGTHPYRTWYKLNADDSTPILNIGGDLKIGGYTLAKYEQSAGNVTVDGNVEIWKGTTSPSSSSYLYMGLNSGWIEAPSMTNHDGYFDQDGGYFEVTTATNDSTQGIYLDNSADFRANTLINNAGTIWMYRNAIMRGRHAFGSVFFICEFTTMRPSRWATRPSTAARSRGR